MADLKKYRSSQPGQEQKVQMPAETRKFLANFKGNIVVCPIGERPYPEYLNPNTDEFKSLWLMNDQGTHIYWTVNDTDGQGRKAENVTRCRAIFADDDVPRPAPRTDWAIPPSIVVQTSRVHSDADVPDYKYHYYWLTETTDFETWRKVQKGLIDKYRTDKTIHDTPRILRLPGFFNHKQGRHLSVVVDNNGMFYNWDTIVKAFPPLDEVKLATEAGTDIDGEFNVYVLEDRFRNPVESGYITNSINSIIQHMANQGYAATKIRRRIDQLYETIPAEQLLANQKRYYDARVQVDKFIKTAKAEATKLRETTSQALPSGQNVQVLHAPVPDNLEMDWNVLRSNPIPEEHVPAAMLRAAKEVGDWTAVGQDPAILSGVFITSALLSKNVLIHEIDDSLTTHCQSGVCIVMDTGARKSAVYNQMNKPFFEFEERLHEQWESERYVAESMAKAYDTQVAALDKEYGKNGNPTTNESMAYAKQRGALLSARSKLQLQKPWLRSVDITEEKLVRKMAANDGCIAVISDDARPVINNLAGRYGREGSTGEAVYINALTGSTIIYERVNSETEISITHPVLNALLFVQPDAALKLRNSDMFVPSGLAARLPMYFYPVDGADIVRNTKRRPINEREMDAYYRALRSICVRRMDNPLHIRLDDAGMEVARKMDERFATLLASKWMGSYDKSNKLVTLCMMYATCFAAIEDPEFAKTFAITDIKDQSYFLPPHYLNMAFEFGIALFGQSIVSHDVISLESLPRRAKSFLELLRKWYREGKIYEGFTLCGALNNHISPSLREYVPDIVDFLHTKNWLVTTTMNDSRRKLNGGFPDKYVDTGERIYHLNIEGIKKRETMNLDMYEQGLTSGAKK